MSSCRGLSGIFLLSLVHLTCFLSYYTFLQQWEREETSICVASVFHRCIDIYRTFAGLAWSFDLWKVIKKRIQIWQWCLVKNVSELICDYQGSGKITPGNVTAIKQYNLSGLSRLNILLRLILKHWPINMYIFNLYLLIFTNIAPCMTFNDEVMCFISFGATCEKVCLQGPQKIWNNISEYEKLSEGLTNRRTD